MNLPSHPVPLNFQGLQQINSSDSLSFDAKKPVGVLQPEGKIPNLNESRSSFPQIQHQLDDEKPVRYCMNSVELHFVKFA